MPISNIFYFYFPLQLAKINHGTMFRNKSKVPTQLLMYLLETLGWHSRKEKINIESLKLTPFLHKNPESVQCKVFNKSMHFIQSKPRKPLQYSIVMSVMIEPNSSNILIFFNPQVPEGVNVYF